MAQALYFDCFSGASGDMILGALIDGGVPLDGVRSALGSLAIDYGDVTADRVVRSGVSATKFRVVGSRGGERGWTIITPILAIRTAPPAPRPPGPRSTTTTTTV